MLRPLSTHPRRSICDNLGEHKIAELDHSTTPKHVVLSAIEDDTSNIQADPSRSAPVDERSHGLNESELRANQ
jgi:hypothetical protein